MTKEQERADQNVDNKSLVKSAYEGRGEGSDMKRIDHTQGRMLISVICIAAKKNQAMEMRCYRKILRISYKDRDTNEEIRAKIRQAIGSHEDLLTTVKRRKLQWCVHVPCSSGLAKIILQGTVKGGRRQGRQKKKWEDNIREWTGLEFASFVVVVVRFTHV